MGNDTQKPARWSYTAEDFLESTAPYEELEKCNGDPFLQQRMIEAMSKYAASIGFRGLKLMYKRYQQSIRTSQGAYIGENPTNFENQPIELDAGKWEADDSGVRRSDGFGDAVACPHPILPVERLVNIDTGEEKLRLAFRKGAIWRKIIVSKVILANANKVTELAGCGVAVTSQNARAFVEYISDIENLNYDVIPERKSIGRFGYIPDEGFSPFVDGLIFDGDASFAAMFQTVRSHGSEAKWLDIAAEVRAMSTTAKIILAASFSSVLLEPLGCLPFFVHLWGVDSGTGKTVALMVAASVWGDPANEDLMLCGVEDLEPMLYEIYQQPDIEHLVPQRAKDAAKHAYAKRRFPENMEKRNLRHREIWNEPIWAQRRIRKVNDSRLLRALQDAAAQRATSVLNLLSKLITYARKKILKGVDSYYEWKKLH